MGKIRLLTEEEYEKYATICFNVVTSLDGESYSFFIYEHDGKELLTFRQNDLFTIVTVDGDDLLLSQFSMDEEYKVNAIGMGEYDYYHHNGTDYFINHNTGIQEQVDFLNRDFEADKNGIIAYIQYDPLNDSRALITYNQYKNTPDGEKGFILGHYLKKPDTISFQFNVSSKKLKQVSYIKQDIPYDVALTYFNIISVKDFGLENVLSKGAVALQKSDSITRYFKILGQKRDGTAITGFPFCNVYSFTDMADMLLERGFKPKIPQLLIDFYNGNYEPLKFYQQFVDEVKKADKEGLFSFDDDENLSM